MKPATRNSALISNTTLCEVSSLLESPDHTLEWDYTGAYGLADLLSLIEAVSLHGTLYTLPARMKRETGSLHLRNELISRGIVKVLDTSEAHEPLAQSILLTLSKTKNVANNNGRPIDFRAELENKVASFLMLDKSSDPFTRLDLLLHWVQTASFPCQWPIKRR